MTAPDDGTAWVRLAVGNDWGVDYLAPLEYRYHGSTADKARAAAIKAGDSLAVRWPDGSITTEAVVAKSERRTIPDMGHSYEIVAVLLGVVRSVGGVDVWVSLAGLEVDAAAVWNPRWGARPGVTP